MSEYLDASGWIVDFHSLRHTFIINLARGKVHPKNAQALVRQSTINLTMNAYTHAVLGDLAADVGKLPAPEGPLHLDDDPERYIRRRAISDLACDDTANDGGTWR